MSLSQRLSVIKSMVKDDYDHIWDCCCDHGFLGMSLLSSHHKATIHFVDIVPSLIKTVEDKLTTYSQEKQQTLNYKTHCCDVKQLPLSQYRGKHLIIIAGVGGDLTAEFVKGLMSLSLQQNFDFLLCPVHHLYMLRSQLNDLSFYVENEKLVYDNKRFYEVLLISSSAKTNKPHSFVNNTGKAIWVTKDVAEQKSAEQYLKQLLCHYKRIAYNNGSYATPIIAAYNQVKVTLATPEE